MKDILARRLASLEISFVIDGWAILDDEWNETNVKSPFSRLYYIKKGSAFVICDNREIKMTSGHVYLIPAETEFSYRGIQGDLMEKRFFHLSILSPEQFDLLSGLNGIYSLPLSEVQVENVFKQHQEGGYTDVWEIKGILYKTIAAFFRKYNFSDILINEHSPLVKKAMEYIQQNLKVSLTLKEIADSVFISESKLRKQFKDEMGITVGSYIDKLVFDKAKRLLIQDLLSIKEISDELGFTDRFYFSRRFKEINDKTPTQYRKENKLFMY